MNSLMQTVRDRARQIGDEARRRFRGAGRAVRQRGIRGVPRAVRILATGNS